MNINYYLFYFSFFLIFFQSKNIKIEIFNSFYKKKTEKMTTKSHFDVPEGTTTIYSVSWDEWGVNRCEIESLTIPDSVKNIFISAFKNFKSLKNLVLPESITYIDDYAFEGCSSLVSINIPCSVTGIGNGAFYGCASLLNIKIPDTVNRIGVCAFYGCSSLNQCYIGTSNINDNLFTECVSLMTVIISYEVTRIGFNAFSYCINLKKIIIPRSVKTIERNAFEGCRSLKNIRYVY